MSKTKLSKYVFCIKYQDKPVAVECASAGCEFSLHCSRAHVRCDISEPTVGTAYCSYVLTSFYKHYDDMHYDVRFILELELRNFCRVIESTSWYLKRYDL